MDVQTIKSFDLTYHGINERLRVSDDCELYYELEGAGPCVTFVSTIYVVSTSWRNFTRSLVRNNRLLTYDLRNQGASSGAPAGFDQHTTDLVRLLDHLGIERTYLVGSSLSTVICRDFAVRHPDRVAGLVLVGPTFSPWGSKRRTRIMKSWLTTLEASGPRQLFDAMYPLVFGDRAQGMGGGAAYLALRERFLAINSAAQLRANLTDALETTADAEMLPRVAAPALLLAGDDDFCISPSGLRALAGLMPDARAEVFDDCGHLPFFETTERFERSLCAFVESIEERQRAA
ncbi:alpha/beta hydrolase [Nocardia sp. NPDC050697]|uniref:alpha/beta fold hydrolase n=1 Tax=Nocardia sp. NPDC050697 TaxID=3155158 RepID=UPI0033DE163E